jgi:flagellar P-ring protein precursor FlgI
MGKIMKRIIVITLIFMLQSVPSAFSIRLKDISGVSGVRENQLIGYGLVVGLNKTGDHVTNTKFSAQTMVSMLEKLGTTVEIDSLKDLKVNNIAAVMVTSNLPPFARSGSRIDVNISSLGDAISLAGGTLLITPLRGANGEIYAVAQGSVSVGGAFTAKGKRGEKIKNHATAGIIPGGALVEKEVLVDLLDKKTFDILLRKTDFTTAINVTNAINKLIGDGTASPLDSGTVRVKVPSQYKGKAVELISAIELIDVITDTPAKVVLDERTGTVVVGKDVKLLESAISHGNLTITIKERSEVVQPPPLSGGTTEVVPAEEILVEEKSRQVLRMPSTTNITELVNALNSIGVTTKDLIAILQALKSAGSLQAELEII